MEEKMGVLFLFGAGASFGSGPCLPTNPPLGRELLIRMREEGGIAETIEGDLLECFIKDPEQGMMRFFEERNRDTTELLKQMCAYLAKFSITDGNAYIKLFSILRKRKNICIATTNYDMLIEQAISATGNYFQYQSLPRNKNSIPILKIHGSINFVPQIDIRNGSITLDPNGTDSAVDAAIDIYTDLNAIINYCTSDTALSPAVALYHPKKRVIHCPSFVKSQQKDFCFEVERSTKIFIIGLKINIDDIHIWNEIEKTKADIFIVDKDKESSEVWIKKSGKKNIYHIADTFEDSIIRIKNILKL